jgi:hypothetical protein
MADQRELQAEESRTSSSDRRLERDLQKKEKALAEAAALLMLAKKLDPYGHKTRRVDHGRGSPKSPGASP